MGIEGEEAFMRTTLGGGRADVARFRIARDGIPGTASDNEVAFEEPAETGDVHTSPAV
ncbi:MAG: hypothetical protein HOY71_15655 [Nonomuraea sp.]|nr:hypothetical protein [Nonomuraea sp.]